MNGFAILSRRPVWADWHMGGMVMWAPEAYAQWSRRWKQLKQIRSVSHARKLAKREGVEFIVYDKEMFAPDAAPKKCIAYQNARFWIMKTC
jgi:hypothetical protein